MIRPARSGNRILHATIFGALLSSQIAACDPLKETASAQKLLQFGDLPISFEPNRGQASSDAQFVSRGMRYNLSLQADGATLDVSGADAKTLRSLNLRFVNSNPRSSARGVDALEFRSHYFIGNDASKWVKDVPNFAKVRYSQMWKGVDVIFYGNEGRLEYDLVVAAGANPKNAGVAFPGASLRLNENGDLILHSPQGDFLQHKPVVYQMADNRRQPIPARYVVAGNRVSFEIGKYDHSRELVIDPVLSYSLGRIDNFYVTGTGVGVDGVNFSLVGGTTIPMSVGQGLPIQPNGYVARIDALGHTQVKVNFGATDGPITVNGLAADAGSHAYLTGTVGGSIGFPLTNAFQTTSGGGGLDAFLIRFDFNPARPTDLPTIAYSTYLGGNGSDSGNGVAADNSGHAYVAGGTISSNFPRTAGVAPAGTSHAFVTEFNTTLAGASSLVYSWVGGGSGSDAAQGVAVDASGNAYVGGSTSSQNFQPSTSNGVISMKTNSLTDGFVAKLNSGAAVTYFSYFPAAPINAVAADNSGNAYVTGETNGQLYITSVNTGYQLSGGANHAFVARFNTNASGANSLVYSSYLAGGGTDIGLGIATDGSGVAHVVGATSSSNFPVVAALQPAYGGGTDAFLSVVNTNASGTPSLVYSSFLGGSAADAAFAVALTPYHNPVIAGSTFSPNFGIPPDGGTDQRAFTTKVLFEAAPFGVVDTPTNNTSGLAGAFNVGGWALSPITVANIGLWREPVNGEPTAGNGLVFLVNATTIAGARPDVAAAFPGYPNNNYGWGAQILTNGLPGTNGLPQGNGTYKLHAIAVDPEGLTKDLSGPVTVSVNNAASVLPFGTIDTPTQGGVASGSAFVNFGWVLTPQPNIIPTDGSTITVFIDNQPVGHPNYNFYRSDVSCGFPGYRNSGTCGQTTAQPGPVGYFIIDTTKLTNGLHNIAWSVSDNVGHATGIGSRFFIVQN